MNPIYTEIVATSERLEALHETTHNIPLEKVGDALDDMYNVAKVELDALSGKTPVLDFGVADGTCWYAEAGRDATWSLMVWVWGGGDSYMLPVGNMICVPVEEVDRRVEAQQLPDPFAE